jgi:hypothetical protein
VSGAALDPRTPDLGARRGGGGDGRAAALGDVNFLEINLKFGGAWLQSAVTEHRSQSLPDVV